MPKREGTNEAVDSSDRAGASSRRPLVLMGILLILVIGYLSRPYAAALLADKARHSGPPSLSGTNSLSNLKVNLDSQGRWIATFDYFYTGEPEAAYVQIVFPEEAVKENGESVTVADKDPLPKNMRPKMVTASAKAQRGTHKAELAIGHPYGSGRAVTTMVVAQLISEGRPFASQTVGQIINWPDWMTWSKNQIAATMTDEQVVSESTALIDAGDEASINEAKQNLERVVSRNPKYAPTYVELARVAMKLNWGPEGLHQAENLVMSALQIEPNNVNAKILLGYVYAHQNRFKSSEALFAEVAPFNPPNAWLWTNWGELLLMQGKTGPAIEKYEEAVARPRILGTCDCARLNAYGHLLGLLDQRHDLDGMERFQKQRASEYGPDSCYNAEYAQFMLERRGDANEAIRLAKQTLTGKCQSNLPRETLGLAYYKAWSDAADSEKDAALNQARAFLPPGPHTLFLLSRSDSTFRALQQLIASGESVDGTDNDNDDALSYALQEQNLQAARRLLKLDAHPEMPVGPQKVPVAFIPVIRTDVDAIRMMQQAGVDYTKLTYQGITAIEYAKKIGDPKLMDALDPKLHTL